ncbi:O-antigen polymerase [Arthrobacter sp. MMS24-S77]
MVVLNEIAVSRANLSPVRWVLGFVCTIASLAYISQVERGTIADMAVALVVAWAGALLATWRKRRGITGALTIYLIVFGLFHAGLVISLWLLGPSVLLGQGDNTWVYSSNMLPAVSAVCLAFTALVLGAGLWEIGHSSRPVRFPTRNREPNIGFAGAVALVIGAGLVTFVFATNGGLSLIGSGYGKVLESVGDSGSLGYGVALLGLGAGFMVCAGGRYRRIGWWAIVGFAVIALPIGLRGAVLFPVLVMIVCEGRQRPIRSWVFVAVTAFGLMAISVLRQTRQAGLAGLLNGAWTSASPIDGMAEMGYTLYPVVVVQEWLGRGIGYQHGQTLVAPLLRQFESLFLGGTIPATSDSRLFNVEVLQLVGPIGGSPVAEAMRNGGPVFLVVMMTLMGFIISLLDGMPSRPLGGALTVVILLPLMIQVRNSFAPVPVQMLIGLVFIFLASISAKKAVMTEPVPVA